jgi:hypothetical protein
MRSARSRRRWPHDLRRDAGDCRTLVDLGRLLGLPGRALLVREPGGQGGPVGPGDRRLLVQAVGSAARSAAARSVLTGAATGRTLGPSYRLDRSMARYMRRVSADRAGFGGAGGASH